jgi:hypothetical protein
VFIFRHFFSLLFLAALGLASHVMWFANTHHGSDKRIDYWPTYCGTAPATRDACAVVLSVANYFGQYKYRFGYDDGFYRIGAFGVRMSLPVTPGTLDDPDSDASRARMETCRAKGASVQEPWAHGDIECLGLTRWYPAYIETACRKVADELRQGTRYWANYPGDCKMVPGFSKIAEDLERNHAENEAKYRLLQEQHQRQEREEAARHAEEERQRTNALVQDAYRRGLWTPGPRR